MHFLMVIPQAFYSTRGTPMSAYHRTRELIEKGHTVDILTYPIGDAPPMLDVTVYRSWGPHFFSEIKSGPSKRKIWFDLLLFLNLIFRLLRKKYDAIYTHEEAAFFVRLLRPFMSTPYVYDMHSSLPRQITDWKFSDRTWVIKLFEFVESQCVKGAAVTVAISPAVADAAIEAWSSAEPIVIVNHFGSDDPADGESRIKIRTDYGISSNAKLILYTGSFVPLQALDMLIDSVPIVMKSVEEAVFLLVGGTQPEIVELRQQAENLGVAEHIKFVESRPQSEMASFFAAADILVSPRVQGINPPGKLFSYLDSGKPVVATDCLVHNQLVDKTCAMLCEPNPDALGEAIVSVLCDTKLGLQLTNGARAFLDKYCSVEVRKSAFDLMINRLHAANPNAFNQTS